MLHTSPPLAAYCCFVAALFGACMGSFLNCMAWRIVHGESVLRGRSHCDECGHVLAARDLVPVLSYLFSKGRCRYCGAKLSSRHVWAELISAAVYVSLLLQYDISLQTLEYILFASLLLGCAFADLEGYMIPDRFILAGIILRPVFLLLGQEPNSAWINSILGGACVAGALLLVVLVYEKLRKVEAMGGGDIKLLFVTGLYLGWQLNILCLFLACILGILFGLIANRKKDSQTLFACGPVITAAAIVTLLAGQPLLEAYLSLL